MSKVVFLTGGATGIGAAIARQMASEGHSIALAIRNPSRADTLCADLADLGGKATAFACDVRSEDDVAAAVEATLQTFGRIDVVINNAGTIEPIGPIAGSEPEAWRASVETNLIGPYLVMRATHAALAETQGTLINISTGAATVPRRAWSAYCGAKAGMSLVTKCGAIEFADDGIYVIAVQPGMVDTDMQSKIRDSKANEVSQIARTDLLPVDSPAKAISWVLRQRPDELRGTDVSLPDLRQAAGSEANW